mgnify:FL=1
MKSLHINTAVLLSGLLATTIYPTSLLAATTADNESEEQPLTDEQADKIFEMAVQERDSGKIFDAIEKFEYILNRRPSLNRARLELAVSYHRAS